MQDVTRDRHLYIGGSDIPIIMGISSFKSRYDLLLEKAELKENEFTGNKYTEYGNAMESKIRAYVCSNFSQMFIENKKISGDIRCHVDGYDFEHHEILEIKTTSQMHSNVNDYKAYLVQLLFYMEQYGSTIGKLAVYERPEDFSEVFDETRVQVWQICIFDYKDLLEEINQAVNQFRADLEKLKANPFLTEQDLMPTDLTTLSNKVLALETELANYDALVKQRDALKEELRQAMLNNGVKKWTTPNNTQITVVPDGEDKEVQKFNEKKFAEEHSDLYAEYQESKVQKGRKGYLKITLPKGV